MAKKVTDPALLEQLNAAPAGPKKVTDPKLLEQLNAQPGAVDTALDTGGGILQGARDTAEGIVGLPGDIQAAAGWVGDKLFGKMTPKQLAEYQKLGGTHLPTSSQVNQLTTGYVDNYDPHTSLGRFARTGTNFATMGALGGLPGMAQRMAMSGLTGLASEGAGQLTEGTAAEPYARVGVALAAPFALNKISKGVRGLKVRSALKEADLDTPEKLRQFATGERGYQGVRDSKFALLPEQNKAWIDATQQRLGKQNVIQRAKEVQKYMGEKRGQLMDAAHLDLMKEELRDLQNKHRGLFIEGRWQGGNKAEYTAATAFLDKLDDHIRGLKQGAPGTYGDVEGFKKLWHESAKNYGIARKAQHIDDLITGAESKAAEIHSGLGTGAKIGQAVSGVISNPKKRYGMTAADIADLEKATIKGSYLRQKLRNVSNKLGGGGGIGQSVAAHVLGGAGGAAAGHEADPSSYFLPALGGVLGGMAARGTFNLLAKNAARNAQRSIMHRAPAIQEVFRQKGIKDATTMPLFLKMLLAKQALNGSP